MLIDFHKFTDFQCVLLQQHGKRLGDSQSPCDFFLWGYVKGLVYFPPLPTNVVELKQRISSALETVTKDMLQQVWDELGYRLDVCHVAGGAHIENL